MLTMKKYFTNTNDQMKGISYRLFFVKRLVDNKYAFILTLLFLQKFSIDHAKKPKLSKLKLKDSFGD